MTLVFVLAIILGLSQTGLASHDQVELRNLVQKKPVTEAAKKQLATMIKHKNYQGAKQLIDSHDESLLETFIDTRTNSMLCKGPIPRVPMAYGRHKKWDEGQVQRILKPRKYRNLQQSIEFCDKEMIEKNMNEQGPSSANKEVFEVDDELLRLLTSGFSPLVLAVTSKCSYEILDLLVNKYGADTNAKATFMDVPLWTTALTIYGGDLQVFKLFCGDEKLDQCFKQHSWGATVLHMVAQNDYAQIAQYVLPYASRNDVNANTIAGTPLGLAVSTNSNNVAKMLIKREDIDINQPGKWYPDKNSDSMRSETSTPIEIAYKRRNREIFNILKDDDRLSSKLKQWADTVRIES